MKGEPSIQNIAKRSIKRLLDSVEDSDIAKDESLSFNYSDTSIFLRWRLKINQQVAYAKKKYKGSAIVLFFLDFFSYTALRLRVALVLVGVLGELINQYTEGFRKFFVRNLFWGRGGIFKFSLHFIVLVIFLVFLMGYAYKSSSPVSGVRYTSIFAQGTTTLNREDRLVQRGTSTTPSPKERGRTEFLNYTVKPGDTLFKIAENNDISTDTLLWANPFIQDDVIRPGDVLNVPPYNGVVVKAKKGDTVYTLGKKYKINPQLIAEKNLKEYPYELQSGETILIPGATPIEKPVIKSPPKVIYSGVFRPPVTFTKGSIKVSSANRFLNWPVSGGQGGVSQCWNGYHNGMDIRDTNGSYPKIVASAPGKVVFAGCQSGNCPPRGIGSWGGTGLAWTVAIDHGNGYSTIYGHLDDIYVGSGSTVSGGQVIGKMGRTGYATGTHVHMMLIRGRWDSWNDVNPSPYFKSSSTSSHASYCWY
ncbi:M23 family metallopeptidase [bacterium]|nr:M23 family metallopeptidase [bacterium]